MKEKIRASLKPSSLGDNTINKIKGGCCRCGCHYEGQPGGSTMDANWQANNKDGLHSPGHDYPEAP